MKSTHFIFAFVSTHIFLSVLVAIVFSAVFSANLAIAAETFDCTGDLAVYIYDGKTASLLSKDQQSFAITSDKTLALAFGTDPSKPVIKVYPWNGIDWVDISKRVPGGSSEHPVVTTDGRTWFTVEGRDSAGKVEHTTCRYQNDDLP